MSAVRGARPTQCAALSAGHAIITNYLLNYFPGLDLERRNVFGFTALMKAAMQGRTECIRALMLAGTWPPVPRGPGTPGDADFHPSQKTCRRDESSPVEATTSGCHKGQLLGDAWLSTCEATQVKTKAATFRGGRSRPRSLPRDGTPLVAPCRGSISLPA